MTSLWTSSRALIFLALPAASLSSTAFAETLNFPPPQATICTAAHIVDKDKLATYLLKKYPVSILAFTASSDPAIASLSPSRQLLASDALANPVGCKACTKTDQANLQHIQGNMNAVMALQENDSFAPTSQVDPNVYFRGANEANAIRCVLVNGQPVEAPGAKFVPPPPADSNFRVRGTAADLYIDRSAKSDFTATSKATFDLTQDNVLKKDTYKIVADVGYAIPTDLLKNLPGDRIDIIPYVGTNWNFVTLLPGSKAKASASETVDGGFLFDTYLISNRGLEPFGNLFTLQGDYLLNNVDDSRLASANLIYTPVLNSTINSFRPLIAGRDDFASFEVIVTAKDDNGFYTDRGKPPVSATHQDYVRLGGQAGFSILSDDDLVPLSLTSTYIRLHPISGETEIGYFSNSLTYSFDPNKYFGISLNYINGNREDTAVRQSQWEIALSGHF